MSEKEEVKKKRKKIDKMQIGIRVMAVLLVLCMIVPVIISGIYALKG